MLPNAVAEDVSSMARFKCKFQQLYMCDLGVHLSPTRSYFTSYLYNGHKHLFHSVVISVKWSESCSVMSDSLWPILWTIQSMEFSKPKYWSGWPFLSPGDLPNPGIKPRSPALQADSLQLSLSLEWVAYPFSSGSSWPRNWTGVSCIAGRFFTNWAMREAPYCH